MYIASLSHNYSNILFCSKIGLQFQFSENQNAIHDDYMNYNIINCDNKNKEDENKSKFITLLYIPAIKIHNNKYLPHITLI